MSDQPAGQRSQDMGELPLAGVRVLDLSQLLPGPYCTLLLADLGAEVIKVEPRGTGDGIRHSPPAVEGVSAKHLIVNRNKESVAIDLKNPGGRGALLRMAEGSDVLVEGFRPGVMERLGCGYEAVAERNPGIVYCSITGYGQDGPYRDLPGHDLNYIAVAGLLGLTGPHDGVPALPGIQVADLAGGALMAAVGILSALWRRARTGQGAHVDISMTDGVFSLLALASGELAGGAPAPRGLGRLTGGAPYYNVYRTSDGRYLAVGAVEAKFWSVFCEAVGRPGWGQPVEGSPEAEALKAELAEIIAGRSLVEWMEALRGLDTCVTPVNSLEEAFEDPHLRERGVAATMPGPGGRTLEYLARAIALHTPDGRPLPRVIPHPAPDLGADTGEVLRRLGFSPDEIAALRRLEAIE